MTDTKYLGACDASAAVHIGGSRNRVRNGRILVRALDARAKR